MLDLPESEHKLALEHYQGFKCKMCHKVLPMTDAYFYYHSGALKPYVYKCKKCYSKWRASLKARMKVPVALKKEARRLMTDGITRRIEKELKGGGWKRDEVKWMVNLGVKLGFIYLGSGYSRYVYAFNDCNLVLKVEPNADIQSDGYLKHQNYNEVCNWKNIPKRYRKYFAKLVAWDHSKYKWVIQERASHPESITKEERSKLETLLYSKGLEFGDLHSDNFGVNSENRIVIIDYGWGAIEKRGEYGVHR